MSDRRKIHYISILLCEDLRVEANGLQTIVGVMPSKVAVQSVPLTLQRLMFRIEFETNDNFAAECSFEMLDPGGESILKHSSQFQVRSDLRNVFVVGWTPVVLKGLGRYSVQFGIGKEKKREISCLEIIAPQQSHKEASVPPG